MAVAEGATVVALGAVFAKNSHHQQNFLRFLLSLICGFGLGDNHFKNGVLSVFCALVSR